MAYDLTDLELFLQVVDQGSITQGAERAHLSLPSASARITAMEKALGARLLGDVSQLSSPAAESSATPTAQRKDVGNRWLRPYFPGRPSFWLAATSGRAASAIEDRAAARSITR